HRVHGRKRLGRAQGVRGLGRAVSTWHALGSPGALAHPLLSHVEQLGEASDARVGLARGDGSPPARAQAGGRHGPQSSTCPQPSGVKPQRRPLTPSQVIGTQGGGSGSSPTQAPRSNSMYRSTFSRLVRSPEQWFGKVTFWKGLSSPPVVAT